MAVGELELLPAIRAASPHHLIIADGFSCREQIAQSTDRHALHLAEVIQMALRATTQTVAHPYPERESVLARDAEIRQSMKRAALGVAGTAAGLLALWAISRRNGNS
jgi:hypothetical protein